MDRLLSRDNGSAESKEILPLRPMSPEGGERRESASR
jgi:hypothetical protein